ncbi:MAG: putative membrane protein YhiD involved in acid resistance [Bacteriovoracaceae bacterium]|jgi:uncharacterized membrane protein YhiD involved in acid resistance
MKSVFSFWDIILNFCLPAILMTPITILYKKTHKGVTYNQAFSHTMYMMAVTVSVIMMIIGSNVARAFSLVGALSIIRFRTAVKDTKDTGYIFASIAIGMSTGTGMYMVAVMFTILFIVLMLLLNYFRVGEKIISDKLLKIELADTNSREELNSFLLKNVESYSLIHSEMIGEGSDTLLTYIVTTKEDFNDEIILKGLKENFKVKNTSLYYNDQRVEI